MRRFSLLPLLLLTLVVGACSDSSSPQRLGGPRATTVQPDSGLIRSRLNALYPTGGIGTAANAQLTNMFRSFGSGNGKSAQQQAAALCKFTQTQAAAGRLISPTVTPPTLADLVTDLCNQAYLYVGLGPGGIDVSGQDAIAVYINHTTEDTIYTPNHHMGLIIPAGTFDQDVTIIVTPLYGSGGTGPLLTSHYQVPWFYDIVSSPEVPAGVDLNHPVTVGICTDETQLPATLDHGRLRIGHNRRTTSGLQFETLPQAAPPPGIYTACAPATVGFDFDELRDHPSFAATKHLAGQLAGAFFDALTPNSAFAYHGGLGGTTTSFSAFGGFDASGVTAVTLAPASATIAVGGTQAFVATPTGSPVLGSTLWLIGNPAVATVSSSGVVTGVAPGVTNLVAYIDGIADTAVVTVTAGQPVSLSMISPSSVQLTGPSGTVSWVSTNPVAATVSSTGLVSSVGSGATVIRAVDAGSIVLQGWPVNTPTFDNYPRSTIAAWPVPVAFFANAYHIKVEFCGTGSSDPTTCTLWSTQYDQTVNVPQFNFDFVGKQAGRWSVQYLDANNNVMGSTGYQYFVYSI